MPVCLRGLAFCSRARGLIPTRNLTLGGQGSLIDATAFVRLLYTTYAAVSNRRDPQGSLLGGVWAAHYKRSGRVHMVLQPANLRF